MLKTPLAKVRFNADPTFELAGRCDNTMAMLVINATHVVTGVSIGDMMGRSHHKSIVAARHLCFWLLRSYLPLSYPEIGAFFDRDHTTIMSGVHRVDGRVKACDDWTLDAIQDVAKVLQRAA